MRRFHGMARCVHLTAALLQVVYRSCLFASLSTSFTGYHWFTSMRDGRGPITELSADGATPSVNVPTPWREATSAVGGSMVWRACGHHIVLYDWLAALEAAFRCQGFVFHAGSCIVQDCELCLKLPPGVWVAPSAYGTRKLHPATHPGGPRLWQRYNWPTTTTYQPFAALGDCLKCFLLLRSLWVFAQVAGFHLNDCIEYFTPTEVFSPERTWIMIFSANPVIN